MGIKAPKSIAAGAMLLLAQQINGGDPSLIQQRNERALELRERLQKERQKTSDATDISASLIKSYSSEKFTSADQEELRCEVREQVRSMESQLRSVRHELKQSIEDAKRASREQARKLADETREVARAAGSRSEL